MPKGIPLTEEEQANRRHEIFHKVVNVFLKKGFHETSMREIAESAGIGKSTLYDYFKTKDDILLYFFEDQLNDLTDAARASILSSGMRKCGRGQNRGGFAANRCGALVKIRLAAAMEFRIQ
mgnify:CR=1 FL=1